VTDIQGILKKEPVHSSETLATVYHTTWPQIPEEENNLLISQSDYSENNDYLPGTHF
jgi:hypothetical protein